MGPNSGDLPIAKALIFLIVLAVFIPARLHATNEIPKLGIELSASDYQQQVEAIIEAEYGNITFLLPTLEVEIGEGSAASIDTGLLKSVIEKIPARASVLLRLRIIVITPATPDKTLEKKVENQLSELISKLEVGKHTVDGIMIEIDPGIGSSELYAFTLATFSFKTKAVSANTRVVVSLPSSVFQTEPAFVKQLSYSVDALGMKAASDWQDEITRLRNSGLTIPVTLRLESNGQDDITGRYLNTVFESFGRSVDLVCVAGAGSSQISRICATHSSLNDFVRSEFDFIGEENAPFILESQTGVELAQKMFLKGDSASVTIFAKIRAAPLEEVELTLVGKEVGSFSTRWLDPIDNNPLSAEAILENSNGIKQTCMTRSEFVLVSIRKLGQQGMTYGVIAIKGGTDLTAQEIVTRWQAYHESQKALLENYTAGCMMDLHFEPTNIASGFDISLKFKYFWTSEGLTEWEQTNFYVNGLELDNRKGFPLPQLEPEKVLTKPLELKLVERYEYHLIGTDEVDGSLCYVIGFDPIEQERELLSGKIWIDSVTFRRIKMTLSQKGLSGSVSSNVETQEYKLIDDGQGNMVNLISSITAQQQVNVAGRNLLLERSYRFSDFVINNSTIDDAITAARVGDNPMYRDTDQGLRKLTKVDNERVLQLEAESRMKSVVSGVLFEGSYDFPIPLLGFSSVDFDFRNTGAQLSIFFAGPILAANLSKQWDNGFRLGFDLALSAIPEVNRIFIGDDEVEGETLYVFEETAGIRATWQATKALSFTAASHLSYNYYLAPDELYEQFVPPRNGITIVPSLETKYSSGGYSLTLGGSRSYRISWKGFGLQTNAGNEQNDSFTKYYTTMAKSYYLGSFTKVGCELSYFGSQDLDRFSQYRSSFFTQPRVRGVPSGTDAFDNVGVASINLSFNAFDFVRFDGYFNHGWGQNKLESTEYLDFEGLELDFGTLGPWSSYLRGTISYALRGNLERYNSRWSVYFLVFLPLD